MTRHRIPGNPDEAARKLLGFLMDQKRIQGAMVLAEVNPGKYACTLITDPALLDRAVPSVPLMPVNAGKMVSRLTMLEAAPGPIAVVLRPCELRALFELAKLEQARLDNLLLVSFTCGGVLPTKSMLDGVDIGLESYREALAAGGIPEGLRDTCRACERFVPEGADVTVAMVGNDGNGTTDVLAETERGGRFLDGWGDADEGELDAGVIEKLGKARAAGTADVLGRFVPEKMGLTGLVSVFGRCINCRACSKACPVCYCSACHFESADAKQDLVATRDDLDRRGGLRLPAGTVYYHVGRMIHVSLSCVGCGMCSDVCPVDIPVASVFTRLAGKSQEMFDYVAGRSADEAIPTSVFETEELEEVGA